MPRLFSPGMFNTGDRPDIVGIGTLNAGAIPDEDIEALMGARMMV